MAPYLSTRILKSAYGRPGKSGLMLEGAAGCDVPSLTWSSVKADTRDTDVTTAIPSHLLPILPQKAKGNNCSIPRNEPPNLRLL